MALTSRRWALLAAPFAIAMKLLRFCALLLLGGWLAACGVAGPNAASTAPPATIPPSVTDADTAVSPQTDAVAPAPLPTINPAGDLTLGYTYHRPDGNRYLGGAGALPGVEPVDIPLRGRPLWVNGAADGTAVYWLVVLQDGGVQAFRVVEGEVAELEEIWVRRGGGETAVVLDAFRLDPIAPPLVGVAAGRLFLLLPPPEAPTLPTHPILLPDGEVAYLGADQVVLGETTVAVDPLPDGRLLGDGTGRVLLLTAPTDRYGHGVLGDELEAGSVTLLSREDDGWRPFTFPMPEERVVEGIAPIWTDWNEDGEREIIVTLSDAVNGAQVAAFAEDGTLLAAGPDIGQGYRWRHQIAVAPFGPTGERELVDVLTPHIGGVVEFYRWEEEGLRIIASVPGYTSHVLGTRNLDLAAAADFDGDGRVELLLPTQERRQLGAIRRSETGAAPVWHVPLDGIMATNLGVVQGENGRLSLAVGRADQTLRLWP